MRCMVLVVCLGWIMVAFPASVAWETATMMNSDISALGSAYEYNLIGISRSAEGQQLNYFMLWLGMVRGDGFYLKGYDYSETLADQTSQWVYANAGELLGDSTSQSFQPVSLGEFYNMAGGDLIANPADFYMGMILEDRTGSAADGIIYGWIHCSIDADYQMTILGTGIDVTGASVVIGEIIPEPTSGMLMLFGFGLLGLRRRRRIV